MSSNKHYVYLFLLPVLFSTSSHRLLPTSLPNFSPAVLSFTFTRVPVTILSALAGYGVGKDI